MMTKTNGSGTSLAGSVTLSYMVSALLIGALIYFANIWNFLGNSRLLSLMIDSGVIKYHDTQAGFIEGIPDTKYYLMSQDPINWTLLGLAVAVLMLVWVLRSLQFHNCGRVFGLGGRYSDHARAYMYGVWLNKVLPFNSGAAGTSLFLESQGADARKARAATYLSQSMVLCEILIFSLLGLMLLGWAIWLGQIFWSLVIFTIMYLFLRGTGASLGGWTRFRAMTAAATERPALFMKIVGLSIVAFALEHAAAYATAMAFTTYHVLLGVDFQLLLMALVGGYVARLVPLTPGGVGQFEWGFATALYIGGVGFPESATVAVIFGLMRIGVGLLVTLVTRMAYGSNTSMVQALDAMADSQ